MLLSACSSMGANTRSSIQQQIRGVSFSESPDKQIVIIYNHGVSAPQQREPCYMPYNKPPPSLLRIKGIFSDHDVLVYALCSTATEAPLPTAAGEQVYLRKREINAALDAFLARGVLPQDIFLAGHSNGGWTSLMMARDTDRRFNGVIAFAPAFAGKRSEQTIAPWWRKIARPRQIKDMLRAPRIDALVYAYPGDPYNRPQDLQFLSDRYPWKNHHGVRLISYSCGRLLPHQTYRHDCRLEQTSKQIHEFIKSQINTFSEKQP